MQSYSSSSALILVPEEGFARAGKAEVAIGWGSYPVFDEDLGVK
jgi:hypothetical protein